MNYLFRISKGRLMEFTRKTGTLHTAIHFAYGKRQTYLPTYPELFKWPSTAREFLRAACNFNIQNKQALTGVLISPQPEQEEHKLQRQKILMFIYLIYNHNSRNINTIYIYNKTSIKRNILTIKRIYREIGRAKDFSVPRIICVSGKSNNIVQYKTALI